MPLFCGAPEAIERAGGGLPPSPVTGLVEVPVPAGPANPEPGSKQVPFIIGGFNAEMSGLAVSRVPINVDPTRKRTYWHTDRNHERGGRRCVTRGGNCDTGVGTRCAGGVTSPWAVACLTR
jgi:hypothetical protein